MKKVKNITKVLEGQKEVAVKVTYSDNTVETYNVPANANANAVLNEIIREGKINLKGYDTSKRILVEQTAIVNTEDSKEVVKKAKKARQAYDDAQAAESKLNNKYADIANIKVNVEGFEENKPESKPENNPKKGRYGLVIFGTAILTGALIWGGSKLAKSKACAPVDSVKETPAAASIILPVEKEAENLIISNETTKTVETKVEATATPVVKEAEPTAAPVVEVEEVKATEVPVETPVVEIENSVLSTEDIKVLAAAGNYSAYVAKCNYTQADLENIVCLLHGLDMINTDCRVTDPYRVEQFFNDMTSEAIENFFETGKINPYNYSVLYKEDSVECKALQNIENGYFAKCYRVAQGLEVDGINVLQDTNEQFEGPFYYAVADRQMIYNMAINKSLTIPAGYIWFDLGDDYKNISYDTQELYQRTDDYTGVMEGLRLDWIHNELARCSDDAKGLHK